MRFDWTFSAAYLSASVTADGQTKCGLEAEDDDEEVLDGNDGEAPAVYGLVGVVSLSLLSDGICSCEDPVFVPYAALANAETRSRAAGEWTEGVLLLSLPSTAVLCSWLAGVRFEFVSSCCEVARLLSCGDEANAFVRPRSERQSSSEE